MKKNNMLKIEITGFGATATTPRNAMPVLPPQTGRTSGFLVGACKRGASILLVCGDEMNRAVIPLGEVEAITLRTKNGEVHIGEIKS